MSPDNKKYDIYERAFTFAVRVTNLLEKLPRTMSAIEYGKQLVRSSGSIGSNIEEADGTLTTKDFINKLSISRRESRESRHWLRLIQATTAFSDAQQKEELNWLVNESTEIMLILSSIIKNTKEKK